MLTRTEAIAAAAAFLAMDVPGDDVRVAPEYAFVDGSHLIVPYDSVARLDHGDMDAELAGNPPIDVDMETGVCTFISLDVLFDYVDRGLFH